MGLAEADFVAGLVIGEVKTEIGDVGKFVVVIGIFGRLLQQPTLSAINDNQPRSDRKIGIFR